MNLSGAWRRCIRLFSSPSESSRAAGHGSGRGLLPSAADAYLTRGAWRRGFLSALLCLPLLAAFAGAAQAQTPEDVEVFVFGNGTYTEGEPTLFTVVTSGRPAHDVTVELTISQVGDFLASGEAGKRRITVPGGKGQKSFSVATRDDNRNEEDGVIFATINPRKGYFPGPRYGGAMVRVEDNDVPVVDIAAGPAIVEGDTATFKLTADLKPARRFQVSLTVQDGEFSPGDQLGKRSVWIETNGKGTLEVRTWVDLIDEDDGFITATIEAGDNYEVGASASATVEVTDGGAPTPRITLSAPSAINEGGTATFTLSASPAPAAPVDVTVDLTEQGSFASAGEIGRRTVAVGTDGTGTFTVATENDRTAEADGSITATLAKGSGYIVRFPGEVSVKVRDATPRVSIAAGPAIAEGGTASFTLTASPHLSESFDVTVDVSESGSFADGGETGSRTVTIGTDGTGTLQVTTFDDATLEADGTITAAVAAGTGYGVGAPSRASVSVADATPRVSIAAGGTIIEGDNASFTLTADPKPSATISVDVDVSDSGDFLASSESGTRSVSIDSTGRATLVIATDDDTTDEQQGRITVRIEDGQTPASYGVGVSRSASLKVNDDDAGQGRLPQLSVGDAEVQERDARNRIWLEFPVSLDRPSGRATRATFEIRETAETATTAPATEGKDFRVRHAQALTVSFLGRTRAVVRIEVLDDDEYEEKPETFELVVVDIAGAEIADGRAIGTILPDPLDAPRGTPIVTIEGGRAVSEGSAATFTLKVEPAPEEDLVVTLSVFDDPAGDFLAATSEGTRTVTVEGVNDRTFAYFKGVVRQSLDIDTVDDEIREDDGSIRVAVDSDPDPDTGGTYDPGAQDYEASVDVRDNERKVPVIAIRGGDEVTEGGEATFTLTADPAPEHDLIVSVFVHDDVASDFLDSAHEGARTVTIQGVSDRDFARQRHTTRTLTVRTVDDGNREDDGSLRVTVEDDPDPAAGGEYLVHEQSYEASTAVKDNERGVPTVTIAGGDGVTEGERAVFTLTADPAPEQDLVVSVTVSDDGTSDFVDSADEGTRTVTIRGVSDRAFAQQRHTTRTLTVDTVDDEEREDDGSIRVVVERDPDPAAGGEYLANTQPYQADVAVKDNERGVPTVTIVGGPAVAEGGAATFTLTADPAPERDLTVTVDISDVGDFVADADEGQRSVVIAGVSDSAFARQRHTIRVLTVQTDDDSEIEATGGVTVTIQTDSDGHYEADTQPWSATVEVRDNDTPTVSVVPPSGSGSVTEGASLSFTLRVEPTSATELLVDVTVAQPNNDYVDADPNRGTGSRTITIPANASSAVVTVDTVNDSIVETAPGTVTVTVEEGSGYVVAVPPGDAASAAVVDNDGLPAVSVHDLTVQEKNGYIRVRMTLSEPPTEVVQVSYATSSTRGTATPGFGNDYFSAKGYKQFGPGQTEKFFGIRLHNDSIDDPGETIIVELSNPVGLVIADGEAVITIENDDPLPGAWLARFGRTVAEQALDGIAGRMAAPRTPGIQGTLAGQSLSFDPAASGQAAAGGAAPRIPAADRDAALAMLAMTDIARGLGADTPAPAIPSGAADPFHSRFGTLSLQSRGMTAREALLGSSFSLTGQKDGAGGTLAFWGRASQGNFDGKERGDGTDITLDGEVTTGMLGADYARGKWLVGLALTQSSADGSYAAIGGAADAETATEDGVVQAGDSKVEASLTAAIPFASLRASERLKLWGAAGYGSGEVMLKTAMGDSYKADTTWSMAAAGLRGDLLSPPAEGSGPALALTSDALWARTSSEKTRDLAATEPDVTRLRLGLEGSYRLALSDGGSLVPKLEVGARHDGGDAETGFGVELGGGIAWTDPSLGLSLDVSGRTLLAHEDGEIEDRGVSAALAFDPAPGTRRGPSLSLGQEFGGRAEGGLDALFAPDPLEDRTGSEVVSRWTMEAAYGFPAFDGRFTGSPHVGLGLATAARDYTLGWRLTPEGQDAPDLSFGLKATRRESDTDAPEHTVGFEAAMRW